MLLNGVLRGDREISNEMLFRACTYEPSGNPLLDSLLHALLVFIRSGLQVYNEMMVSQYVTPEHQ